MGGAREEEEGSDAGPAQDGVEAPLPDAARVEVPVEAVSTPPWEAVVAGVAAVAEDLGALGRRFDRRLAYDQAKELILDRLHGELERHRRDMLAATIDPLLRGVLRIRDEIEATVARREAAPDAAALLGDLRYVVDALQLLLEDHGVEAFTVPSDRFDGDRQRAAEVVPGPDDASVGALAGRLSRGFARGAVLLRKEQVRVYGRPAPPVEPAAALGPIDPATSSTPGHDE